MECKSRAQQAQRLAGFVAQPADDCAFGGMDSYGYVLKVLGWTIAGGHKEQSQYIAQGLAERAWKSGDRVVMYACMPCACVMNTCSATGGHSEQGIQSSTDYIGHAGCGPTEGGHAQKGGRRPPHEASAAKSIRF